MPEKPLKEHNVTNGAATLDDGSRTCGDDAAPQSYQFLMGSDIVRDGMFLEMLDASGTCVAEVFYFDVTARMVVTLEYTELPVEAVQELLSRAKLELPSVQKPEATTSAGEDVGPLECDD